MPFRLDAHSRTRQWAPTAAARQRQPLQSAWSSCNALCKRWNATTARQSAKADTAPALVWCDEHDQLLNTTSATAAGVTTRFTVHYGPVPFTIVEELTPAADGAPGVYVKRVRAPGSKLLGIPTVVVDVDADKTLTLFSCVDIAGVAVRELIFATRARNVNATVLGKMERTAQSVGLRWQPQDLKRVEWRACPAARPRR